jgi:hypothetical protein
MPRPTAAGERPPTVPRQMGEVATEGEPGAGVPAMEEAAIGPTEPLEVEAPLEARGVVFRVDPGEASPELIARVLAGIDALDQAYGGSGLRFTLAGDRVTMVPMAWALRELLNTGAKLGAEVAKHSSVVDVGLVAVLGVAEFIATAAALPPRAPRRGAPGAALRRIPTASLGSTCPRSRGTEPAPAGLAGARQRSVSRPLRTYGDGGSADALRDAADDRGLIAM